MTVGVNVRPSAEVKFVLTKCVNFHLVMTSFPSS